MTAADVYELHDRGSPGHLQLLDDLDDRLLSVRKSDELQARPDSAPSAAINVLDRPHEANTDGLADGGLDQNDESVSDEKTRVIVVTDWKYFESNPKDGDVENTTLAPFRCVVILNDVAARPACCRDSGNPPAEFCVRPLFHAVLSRAVAASSGPSAVVEEKVAFATFGPARTRIKQSPSLG